VQNVVTRVLDGKDLFGTVLYPNLQMTSEC
jgi:hypothetical protein